MSRNLFRMSRKAAPLSAAIALGLLFCTPAIDARVTRIVIDGPPTAVNNQPGYEQLTGRAFGTLDPNDSHNAIITDIGLVQGTPTYVATFVIRKPKDMNLASGVMWHDVPNRGGDVGFNTDSFAANDVQLLSGWQGDNAGGTAVPNNVSCVPPYVAPCAAPTFANHYVKTPVVTGVTGRMLGRIINRSGSNQPLNVMGNPIPYFPANSADNSGATLALKVFASAYGTDHAESLIGIPAFQAPVVAIPVPEIALFKWVRDFNPYDLYTKSHQKPDVAKLRPFYQELIAEYFPDKLSW